MATASDTSAALWEEGPLAPDTSVTLFFRKVSFALAWVVLTLVAFGLADTLSVSLWPDDHAHALDFMPHQPYPVLACFALAGVAVLGSRDKRRFARWLQAVCGALILVIGISCSTHAPHAFCNLDARSSWIVLLTGFAIGAGASRIPVVGYVRQLSLFTLFFLCGLILIAFLYVEGATTATELNWMTPLIALMTAHAMLFQYPGFGVMRLMSGNGFGSHITRRLVPSVIALLVVLGWLLAQGERLGWYPPAFGESLYAVLALTGFSGILLFTAASLNRLDGERRKQEAEIRRDRAQLQAILDHATAMICMKDLSGRYLMVNQSFARSAGQSSPESCVGKTARDLFAEDVARDAERDYKAVLETRAGIETVKRLETPDGVSRTVLAARFPLLDGDGAPYAVCGIYTDISDITRQEEEIRRLNASLKEKTLRQEAANSELEAFSYSVSHDLRAPLRHIAGFAQLLAQRNRDGLDAKSLHYLDVIQVSVSRMGTLIDDLLSFSRASKVELASKLVDTRALVAEIRAELDVQNRGTPVAWEIGPLPEMRGDPAMLRLVWVNLLSNAVKYSSKHPTPRVQVGFGDPHDPDAYFVRDNGAGFDMRYADKLFGVFQRLHSSQEYEGTGIGLAMVRRILERHGGRIGAQAAPGEGACFYFVVPGPDRDAPHQGDATA